MFDAREFAPALWGLAGALAYGLSMVMLAFRTPEAAPGARRKALLDLALGVFVGPLGATVFGSIVLFWIPKLDPKAVHVTLGLIAVPALPRFVEWVQDELFSRLRGKS